MKLHVDENAAKGAGSTAWNEVSRPVNFKIAAPSERGPGDPLSKARPAGYDLSKAAREMG